MPNVMGLEDGALGRCLGHESETLRVGIKHCKKALELFLAPAIMSGQSKKAGGYELDRGPHQKASILAP